jgi:outer membrane protein OmpA-like peptidoglycan-associated protein
MTHWFTRVILLLVATLALAACAPNDPYMRAKTGAAIGAIAGGVLGHQLDDDAGRYVGAAAGAALGGGIGYAMDRQEQQLQQLAMQNQQLQMEVQRLQDGSLLVGLPSEVLFDFDSAAIKPQFMPALDEMARILNQDPRSTVTVIGHTDSTGSEAYNMDLSRRRAQSVSGQLGSRGVDPNRLFAEGRGESQPRASNATPEGRAQNRRVELIIRPIG